MYRVIGDAQPQYLLADVNYVDTFAIPCEPGEGVIPTGTLMYRKANGLYAPAGEEECTEGAYLAVLGEDVDVTASDKIAEDALAYRSGIFVWGTVKLKDGAELKKEQEVILRKSGIVFARMVSADTFNNLLFGLPPAAMDGAKEAYKVKVSDLQENISIGNTEITGHLKHVKDFSSAGFGEEEKEGNFLALQFEIKDGVTTKTELEGAAHPGESTLSAEDNFCVYRITDNKTQKIKVKRETEDGKTLEITYGLSGLICDKE